jgi:hypothetical protein
MQCETWVAIVALLLFAGDAIDRGGLEDYVRFAQQKATHDVAGANPQKKRLSVVYGR